MAKKKEVCEWDMTDEEKKELKHIIAQKDGFLLAAEVHQIIGSRIAERETHWWDGVAERLGLDMKQYRLYFANLRDGKIIKRRAGVETAKDGK